MLHERLSSFIGKVNGDAVDVDWRSMARRIASLPAAQRRTFLAAHPAAKQFLCLSAILDLAHSALGNAPGASLALADLVHGVVLGNRGDTLFLFLQARAWEERASAECELGDLLGAQRSYRQAMALHVQDPLAQCELADVCRGRALILHRMGDSEDALSLLRRTTRVFETTGETGRAATSLLFEGLVHFENDRVERATRAFERALELSRRRGDDVAAARLSYHLGNCERRRGNRAGAMISYRRALSIFRRSGTIGDRLRVVWAMTHFLVDDGCIDAAAHALGDLIAEMSAAGLALDEARARCDLAEILVLAERHERARQVGRGVLGTLTRAGLFHEASAMLRILGGWAGLEDDDARRTSRGDS